MNPASIAEARTLLRELGAPPRLLRHVELVGEAAELLLAELHRRSVPVDADLVRVGVVLHDAGKVLHPGELDRAGGEHEPAGEALLLDRGVSPMVARICMSHARWSTMPVSFEELLVALSDKLWKGVRKPDLEERVIDGIAERVGKQRWDVFVELDQRFEAIAEEGTSRLDRSHATG